MTLTLKDIKKIESLLNQALKKRIEPLERRMGSLDQKVSNLDKKTSRLISQTGIVYNQIDALGERTSVLEDKINLLPTKDEFFTKMDQVMGELKTSREEEIILSHQVSEHDKRITDLEENQKLGRFSAVV